MRHQKKQLKLNCQQDHRLATIRNLATSLILFESIKTTVARAKAVRPTVEDLITKAKTLTPAEAIRQINEVVFDKNASKKLIEVLRERYKERKGGYTKATKLGNRPGDSAQMIQVQLVQ